MTLDEFLHILHDVPPSAPIFYRLYYNDHGEPLFYSMEDLPGNYIDIDAALYTRSPRNVKVKDGKIYETASSVPKKLVPGSSGTACDPYDVCVIVDDDRPNTKWRLKTYESY